MQAKIRPLDKLCLGLGRGLVSEKAELMQGIGEKPEKMDLPGLRELVHAGYHLSNENGMNPVIQTVPEN